MEKKLASLKATLVWNYDWPTRWLNGVECRATAKLKRSLFKLQYLHLWSRIAPTSAFYSGIQRPMGNISQTAKKIFDKYTFLSCWPDWVVAHWWKCKSNVLVLTNANPLVFDQGFWGGREDFWQGVKQNTCWASCRGRRSCPSSSPHCSPPCPSRPRALQSPSV